VGATGIEEEEEEEEEDEEDLVKNTNCEAPHYAVTSTPSGPRIFLGDVDSHNLNLCSSGHADSFKQFE
jgi:hypothetical protein